MRNLDGKEARKRGCAYCANSRLTRGYKTYKNGTKALANMRQCEFDKCPYTEMDKYNTYAEYMDSVKPLQFNMPKSFDW
jgi:hypothetical protein